MNVVADQPDKCGVVLLACPVAADELGAADG